MKINLIYARSRNGVIGVNGQLPWHLPEDLAHFKQLTMHDPVIMGRKTWESLPARFRPLPGRLNVVITSSANVVEPHAQVLVLPSLQAAFARCAASEQVWVIGGSQMFAAALPFAHAAEVTWVEEHVAGDAFAPELPASWQEVSRLAMQSASGVQLSFVRYENPNPIEVIAK